MTTETKATHTSGPWSYATKENGKPYVCMVNRGIGGIDRFVSLKSDSPEYPLVCNVVVFSDSEENYTEAYANARLIAAAPELLAALEKAVNRLRNQSGGSTITYELNDLVIDQAQRAIQKAKGG
jgi:hypothetical protein